VLVIVYVLGPCTNGHLFTPGLKGLEFLFMAVKISHYYNIEEF
jgi:hypothetical protein